MAKNIPASSSKKIPLLIIAGPTAVGKTTMAISAAQKFEGEIISADSAQVYRYLNIGTAKPDAEEQKGAKHHLIDIIDPVEQFSVADYQKLANDTVKEIFSRGKLPVLCGGTGLYINALIDGYVFSSKGRDSELRSRLETIALEKGLKELYERLTILDPLGAQNIHSHDKRRIIRALEVYYQGGGPISNQIRETCSRESPFNICFTGINMEREALYERINERTGAMIENGLICEVQKLLEKYPLSAPGLQVLGYRHCVSFLQNNLSFEELKETIKKETRNYAKRQYTWFKKDKRIKWFNVAGDDKNSFYELILSFMKENRLHGRII